MQSYINYSEYLCFTHRKINNWGYIVRMVQDTVKEQIMNILQATTKVFFFIQLLHKKQQENLLNIFPRWYDCWVKLLLSVNIKQLGEVFFWANSRVYIKQVFYILSFYKLHLQSG